MRGTKNHPFHITEHADTLTAKTKEVFEAIDYEEAGARLADLDQPTLQRIWINYKKLFKFFKKIKQPILTKIHYVLKHSSKL